MCPKFQDISSQMSATFDRAYALADRLVREEMCATRANKPDAIESIAAQAGIAPGTIQNLFKRRLKHADRIEGALQGLALRHAESRAIALRSQVEQIRAGSRSVDLRRLADVEAAVAALERVLAEEE